MALADSADHEDENEDEPPAPVAPIKSERKKAKAKKKQKAIAPNASSTLCPYCQEVVETNGQPEKICMEKHLFDSCSRFFFKFSYASVIRFKNCLILCL